MGNGKKYLPGPPTRPKERAALAPISTSTIEDPPSTRPALEEAADFARDAEDAIVTMVPCVRCGGSKSSPCTSCAALGMVTPTRADALKSEVKCPLCAGCGTVAPEIATTLDGLVEKAKEQA